MKACREESSAFNPTRFSWLSLRLKCLAGKGIFWKTWGQQILLANVLKAILHKEFPKAKVMISRHCSTFNFSKDYFANSIRFCK